MSAKNSEKLKIEGLFSQVNRINKVLLGFRRFNGQLLLEAWKPEKLLLIQNKFYNK